MNNLSILRKIMIALLAIATVIVVVTVLKNSIENGATVPEEEAIQQESGKDIEQNQQVDRKSISVLINEKGFTPNKVTIHEDTSIEFENMSEGTSFSYN